MTEGQSGQIGVVASDGIMPAVGITAVVPALRHFRLKPWVAVLTLATVAGCSTLSGWYGGTGDKMAAGTPKDPATRIEELERKVASLQEEIERLRPALERLVSMEGDLRTLVALVGRRPDGRPPTANTPGAPGGAAIVLSPPAQSAAAATPPGAPTAVATKDQFSVHLASFRDQESARKGWPDFTGKHADLLGGLDYRISPITPSDNRGTFQRLKAGPFTDSASANEVCKLLKTRKVYCAVTDFAGAR